MRQSIRHILKAKPPAPTAHGWVVHSRHQKKRSFLEINDGSTPHNLHVVVPADHNPQHLTPGSSLAVTGDLVHTPQRQQPYELQASALDLLGHCDPSTYPLRGTQSVHRQRIFAHMRPRAPAFAAMLRVRAELEHGIHAAFRALDFIKVPTPVITSSDAEGAGEVFQVTSSSAAPPAPSDSPLPMYLTVSSQLHLEALAAGLSNVYTLTPCFRAENSHTSRHLQEFWMLEAEFAFTSSDPSVAVHQAMDNAEAVIQGALRHVLAHTPDDLALLADYNSRSENVDADTPSDSPSAAQAHPQSLIDTLTSYSTAPFARISYTEAIDRLQQLDRAFEFPVEWGISLQSEHEQALAAQLGPVFIFDYPAHVKAWYMKLFADPAGRRLASSFDLIFPHAGELVGGSVREESLPALQAQMDVHSIPHADYSWYMDLRRYGSVPHAGWGLGLERLVSFVTGMRNVRETIPFPRGSEGSIY